MTRPILLDVTRLASRAGLRPTGVDRVEAAYLNHVLHQDRSVWGLARTALGHVLLDRRGLSLLQEHVAANVWPDPDLVSRLNPRLSPEAARGQTAVRGLAVARCSRLGLSRLLRRRFPGGVDYYSVGHANLTERVLDAIPGRVNVLVHDVIPLTHPQFQRAGTVEAFRRKMSVVANGADRIICTTRAAEAEIRAALPEARGTFVVAPLGVPVPVPGAAPDVPRPYVVALGTIEPRKNLALLLDLWADWPEAPHLVICGRRGWERPEVLARLDARPARVIELPGLADAQVAALVRDAAALVFPSLAEGFGLPPAEALALGTPALVSDLPACREILGDSAVYLDPSDGYQWKQAIAACVTAPHDVRAVSFVPPDWISHFKLVFTEDG